MAYIKAISCFEPTDLTDNDALARELPDVNVAKIAKAVGVSRRYIAKDGETASDLAYQAAQNLFSEYAISPSTIDFVLFCTQSADYLQPASACILQERLGIPNNAGAFDLDLGCSGWVYGLATANSFVESRLAGNVLLLTGDTMSRYLHKDDMNRIVFGDSAAATLVSSEGAVKIGQFVLGTDGKGWDALVIKTGGARHKGATGREETVSGSIGKSTRRDDWLYMDGEAIFNFTLERVPKLFEDTLVKNNITRDEIDYCVFHQANRYMLNTDRKLCKIPKEKFYINMDNVGNTTSSTIPIALKDCLVRGVIHSGMNVLVAGFGVGLSWAACVLRF